MGVRLGKRAPTTLHDAHDTPMTLAGRLLLP